MDDSAGGVHSPGRVWRRRDKPSKLAVPMSYATIWIVGISVTYCSIIVLGT